MSNYPIGDLVWLHEWDDALNMNLEFEHDRDCDNPECCGECNDEPDMAAEAHVKLETYRGE